MRTRPVPLVLVAGLSVVAACSGASGPSSAMSASSAPGATSRTAGTETRPVDGDRSYTSASPERLAEMLRAKDFTLVNVHVPYEGEIEQTDAFIPYDQIGTRLSALPPPDARILVYCRSGRMSTIAARTLVERGYTNIWELDGGMNAWTATGFALEFRSRS